MPLNDTTDDTLVAIVAGTGSVSPLSGALFGGKDDSGNFQSFKVLSDGTLFISGTVTTSTTSSIGTVAQGASGSVPWKVEVYSGSSQIGISNNPIYITGSVGITNVVSVTGSLKLSEVATVTGSIAIVNTASIHIPFVTAGTGSTSPVSGVLVGGKDSNGSFQPLSVTTTGILSVTGSTQIVGIPTITGSVGIVGQPISITGSVQLSGTSSIAIVSAPNIGGTGSIAPRSGSLIAGVSGSTLIALQTDNSGVLQVNQDEEKTFVVSATGSQIGNNKSMIALFNSSSSPVVLKIREVYIKNVQTSAVTGIVADFRFFRITGSSGGTRLTPLPFDTNDTISALVTASTNATVTGEASTPLYRWLWSSDDWSPGTLDVEALDHAFQNVLPVYMHKPKLKPITLRARQGIHIKHTVNSTAGSFDFTIVFTQV